ncbi:MAG TPA: hypothetical protein DCZ91_13710 [Lachnospiraceae bacterium]|nr:hypothetical protein [Lachnospiraceae bacterium]
MDAIFPALRNKCNTKAYCMKEHKRNDFFIILCYFGLYIVLGLSLLIKQPFGNPPDEFNRYLIPQYIAENGTLPDGYEESIRIPGYGFSYAFQPILPYMLQGYAMRLVNLFTDSESALLYTARGVNFLLGLLTAYVVLLLSRQWFRDRRFGWLFAFLAAFLPQSIFMHTYVNTDSCCMLSIALMLYGLTLGLKDAFSGAACVIMAAGIILCALSYYNAYGYILSCILLFTAFYLSFSRQSGSVITRGRFFLSFSPRKAHFDYRNFLKKGAFISAIVLCGIAWWFIRSAVLYDGDFLGLQARSNCASLYAIPEFHPETRVTWQSQGYSLWDMLKDSDFITLSVLSFIGMYGPMTMVTSVWVYRFYKALFGLGVLFCVLLPRPAGRHHTKKQAGRRWFRIFYHINMTACILIPVLLSLIYSYTTDYQPQGRYLLPALLPLCFYTVHGLEKLYRTLLAFFPKLPRERTLIFVSVLLCIFIVGMLALTIYGYAFPYYDALL